MRTDHIHALNDQLDAWLAETDEKIEIATHELSRLQRLRDHLGRARAEATAETGAAPIDLPQILRRHAVHARGGAEAGDGLLYARAVAEAARMAAAARAIEGELAIDAAQTGPAPYPLPEVVDEFPEIHDNRIPARI